MESSILSTKRLLAAVLHEHYNHRYWYYGLTLPYENSNSFASYLEMNQSQYNTLLCTIGVGRLRIRKGKERIELIKNEWDLFLNDCGLSYVYFDQFCCNKVPTNGIDATSPYIKYHGWWIGIGSTDMNSGVTASSQFRCFKNPPRIHGRKSRLTRELKLAVMILEEERNELNQEEEVQEASTTSKGNYDTHTFCKHNKSNCASTIETNISTWLDEFKNNKMGKEDVSQLILSIVMKETIEQVANERIELLRQLFTVPGCAEDEENMDDELIRDEVEKMKKVPGLTHLGIPLHKNVLRVMVRELTVLSNQFPKEGILNYSDYKGVEHALVQVPVCNTKESFIRSNQRGKFIDRLPSTICGGKNAKVNEDIVAEWILNRLGKRHELSFIRTANDLGYNVGSKLKMEDNTAFAMWDESNSNSKSQRVILRYMRGSFGKKIKIPVTTTEDSEKVMKHNIGKYKPVPPVSNMVVVDGEEMYFWNKPLIPSLSSGLSFRLFSNNTNDKGIDNVDLVLGGDHGQRKFRMLMKVIMRKEDMTKIDEFIIKIAHIDCKHETYHSLRSTITPTINCDLNELKGKKVLVFRMEHEGKFKYTCQVSKGISEDTPAPHFICPITQTPLPEFEYVRQCNIRIVVTGDLAFYAAVLGKVNGAGHWCTWCQHSYNDWKGENHQAGLKWTLLRMATRREQLFNKELKNTSANRKGIKEICLFDGIEIYQYIFPILHTEIGLGNYFLNSFFDWIDYRIEHVTDEEKQRRKDFGIVIQELDEMNEKWDEFLNDEGHNLAECILEKSHLLETKEERDNDGNYMHPLQERKELEVVIKGVTAQINELKKKKKTIEDDLKLKKKIYVVIKKQMDDYRAARGKKGDVRIQLERKLLQFGISRPPYHGGDFTGVKIKVLLQAVDKLFQVDFKDIIFGVLDREADDNEVNMMVNMYMHLGFLLDGFFSLARTRCGELTNEIINLTKRMVAAVLKMWRNLRFSTRGTKLHGLEDHLVEQMVHYNGIGDFTEDFVEQSHQTGVRDELRTRGLKRSRAFVSHSQWEWKRNQLGIEEARKEMEKKTSKKRRKKGVVEKKMEAKLSRDERRMGSLLVVESGIYSMIPNYRTRDNVDENE